jgi:hypothetical protein
VAKKWEVHNRWAGISGVTDKVVSCHWWKWSAELEVSLYKNFLRPRDGKASLVLVNTHTGDETVLDSK